MRFVNSSTGAELLPPTVAYKNAKAAYKGHLGYFDGTLWLGWKFFEEYSLTINVADGSITQKSTTLEGNISTPNSYTHSAMDSLALVGLLPIGNAVVYVDDTLELRPAAGHALHPTRGITTTPQVAVTNGAFRMPSGNVTVNVAFEQLYSIDPDSTTARLDTLITTSGIVYPRDSLFAGDSVLIKDIVTPNPGYEIDTVRLWYCSSDPCTWQPLSAPYVTGSPATINDTIIVPGGKIKIDVKFQPSHTVTVYYSENGTLPKDTAVYRLAPDSTLTIPVNPQPCYEKKGISSSHSAQLDADNNRITMPSTAVNMEVWVTYGKISYTLSYSVDPAGAAGSITGTAVQTVECGQDGTEVTATPNADTRFVRWSDNETEPSRKEINVQGSADYLALFEQLYKLTLNVANGQVNAVSSSEVYYGVSEKVLFTKFKPNSEHKYKSIKAYNSNDLTTPISILSFAADTSLAMPAHDVTVVVEFERFYNIVPDPASGTLQPDGSVIDASGNVINRIDSLFAGHVMPISSLATPASGYEVDKVELYYNDGSVKPIVAPSPYLDATGNLIMPPHNVEVVITFKPKYTYEIAYAAGSNGLSDVPPTGLAPGASYVFDVSPDDCHTVAGVSATQRGTTTDVTAAVISKIDETHYRVTMPSSPTYDIAVNVEYDLKKVKLSYDVLPVGAGYIDGPNPQDVDCGTDGAAVEAKPNGNYKFIGWNDGITTASRTDNVKQNTTFTAEFKQLYEVSTMVASGTISGAGFYEAGQTVTISQFKPDAGYRFHSIAAYKTSEFMQPTATPLAILQLGADTTFTMPSYDVTIVVEFRRLYSIDPIGATPALDTLITTGGTVYPRDSLFAGDTVPIKDIVVPMAGYEMGSIVIQYCSCSNCMTCPSWEPLAPPHVSGSPATINDTIFVPDGKIRVEVVFQPIHTVTVTYAEGKADTLSNTVYRLGPGLSLDIPVGAADCHERTGINSSVVGTLSGTTYTVSMPTPPEDITVDVSYDKLRYTLTYNVHPAIAGHIEGDDQQTVECGADGDPVEAKSNNADRYVFAGWNDGAAIPNPRTDQNIRGPISATANFTVKHQVTLDATGGSAQGAGFYEAGQTVTISQFKPQPGYKLDSIRVYNSADRTAHLSILSFGADTTFAMPDHDVTVVVGFTKFYGITPEIPIGGVLQPDGTVVDGNNNRVFPVDSLFAGDRVNVVDIVKPALGYTIGSIAVSYLDGGSWEIMDETTPIRLSDVLPSISGQLTMPAHDIKISVEFVAGYKVNLTYGSGASAAMISTMEALEPSKTFEFAVEADGCHRFKSVSATKAGTDPAEDVYNEVISTRGDRYVVTMPAAPYDIDVKVSYETKMVTVYYESDPANAGQFVIGSVPGQSEEDIYCGSSTTVEAKPQGNYRFVRWINRYNGAEHEVGTNAILNPTSINSDTLFIAVFEPLYEVTVAATNGTVGGAGLYGANDKVTLSQFKPQPGHKLDSIRVYNSADPTAHLSILSLGGDTSFIMPAHDVTVVVGFTEFYSITPEIPIGGVTQPDGAVIDASNNALYPVDSLFAGDRVALQDVIKPAAGYTIDQITICRWDGSKWEPLDAADQAALFTKAPATLSDTLIMPSYDIMLRAAFKPAFTIEVNYLPAGISAIGDRQIIAASPSISVKIPIRAIHGYTLNPQSIAVHEAGNSANSLMGSWSLADSTVTMPTPGLNIEMYVSFVKDTFDLYYSANPSYGSITGRTTQQVVYLESGEPVEAVATAEGYAFKQWNDGRTDNPRTDKNVDNHVYAEAIFERTYTIADSTLEGGTVWFEYDGPLFAGTTVKIHSRPAPCYRVGGLPLVKEKGHPSVLAIFPQTDTSIRMPAHDIVVYGSFVEATTYDVAATMAAYDGQGNPTGAAGGTVDGAAAGLGCGSTVTLTARPAPNHRFVGWFENGTLLSADLSYTIASLSADRNLEARVRVPEERMLGISACGAYTWRGETYVTSGTHTQIVSTGPADTIYRLNLVINPVYAVDTFAAVCGDRYMWRGVERAVPGEYTYTATTQAGCDSAITLHLTAAPAISHSFSATACGSYTWNGQTYTASGGYVQTISTASGCDSTVTLQLTIVDEYNETLTVETCADTYTWSTKGGDRVFNLSDWASYTADDFVWTGKSTGGCDSTVTLQLRLGLAAYNEEISITACSYPFKDASGADITVNTTGDHTGRYTAANGCDSIVTLHFTAASNPAIIDERATTCLGSYTWSRPDGTSETVIPGTYTYSYALDGGCQQEVQLTLTDGVKDIRHEDITVEAFGSYTWDLTGETFISTGTHPKTITSADGCTVTNYTLHLTIVDAVAVDTTVSICASEFPYTWQVQGAAQASVISQRGDYVQTVERGGVSYRYTLNLTEKPAVVSAQAVDGMFCEGSSYLWSVNGRTYTQGGTYTAEFTSRQNGCPGDSIHTLTLIQLGAGSPIDISVSTCESDYTWNGVSYTESGDYTWTGTSAMGCDSVVVLHLTLNDNADIHNTITATACETYIWNGQPYTASGDYTQTFKVGQGGCTRDSIVTLRLTVGTTPAPVVEVDTISRLRTPYTWHGDAYYESGIYHHPYTTEAGCAADSTITLTVLEPIAVDEAVSICANQTPYRWEGNVLDKTGNHEATVFSPSGRDTLKRLHLTVHPTYSGIADYATFCGSYTWEGRTYTRSGNYPVTLQTAVGGCDSTVTLHLTEVAAYAEAVTVSTCEASYAFKDGSGNDIVLTESGVYTGKYYTAGGCDSLVTLTLELGVTEPITHEFSVAACQNYIWNGHTYTASGDYVETFSGSCGRDSTVTLRLTISTPPTAIIVYDEISEGGSYDWDGETYTTPGVYDKSAMLPTGCLQEKVLYLTLKKSIAVDTTVSICASEFPYTWQVQGAAQASVISQRGDYVQTVERGGVSYRYTLNLTEKPAVVSAQAVDGMFCEGSSYLWSVNGRTYTQGGTYTAEFTSRQNGCPGDSIHTLTLTQLGAGSPMDVDIRTCENEYEWYHHGALVHRFEATGERSHTASFTSVGGCDSVVTMTVMLAGDDMPVTNELIEAFCGASYPFKGRDGGDTTLTQSGTYEGRYLAADRGSCRDSIVTLHLTIGTAPAPVVQTATISRLKAPYIWHGDTLYQSGTYHHPYTTEAGCVADSTMSLTVLEPIAVDETVSICDNQVPYRWLGNTLLSSTRYDDIVINPNGQDTLKTLHLTVHPTYSGIEDHATFCGSYTWAGTIYTQPGDYPVTLKTAVGGCDSTVTLHLTEVAAYDEAVTVSTCESSYAFKDGSGNDIVLTASGVYTGKYLTAGGCDSLVTLTLELGVTEPITHEFSVAACQNHIWNNQTYTASGDYVQTFSGSCGRDSVVTLHLSIGTPPIASYEAVDIREGQSYGWEGETYTTPGVYTKIVQLATGCQQHKTLYLNVIAMVYDTIATAICANELPYEWRGQVLNSEGYYSDLIDNPLGDTTLSLHLTVHPLYSIDVDATFCGAAGYTWNGQTYTQAGDYIATFTSASGCDSTVALHLTKVDGYRDTTAWSTCGSSYTWNGQSYSASGIYELQLSAVGGCDSIVVLDLLLNDDLSPVHSEVWESICGDSYFWNNSTYTESGDYEVTLNTGCRDSIVTLHLSIGQPTTTIIDTFVCGVEMFEWQGNKYTSSIRDERTFTTANGCCDSTVVLNLHLHDHERYWLTVLATDSYLWNGRLYTESGSYTDSLKNMHGCDSVVTLYLTIVEQGENTLGVDDVQLESLTLHPNPTTGELFVAMTSLGSGASAGSGIGEVLVYSVSGQLMLRQPLLPVGSTRLDISRMPAGVYVVRAGTAAARVVKL